jgi:signal transduction histidine kinase
MYAELLSEARVSDDTKRGRYLGVIVKESERLTRLVNNVLDFSRLEQSRKQYHPVELDLAATVDAVLENQSVRLREAGLELKREYAQEPILVHTDRDALEQVLLNLIDNAVKYASAGGELTVQLETRGRHAHLHILDRGPGIPTRHARRIFDKFHRVDDSLTASQPGSGLGLSIARRLLQDQHGDLRYRPRANGGTCFTVSLPIE